MSIRLDTAPLIASSLVVSRYTGHGVRGDQIPASGENGASFLLPSASLPADNAVEFRYILVSGPTNGASFTELREDGTYTLSVPGDGTYEWTFTVYADGVSQGNATATVTVGASGVTVAAEPSLVQLSVLDPVPLAGDLVITASPSALLLAALDPTPVRGDLAIAAPASVVTLSALDPSIQTGGLVLTAEPSVVALSALAPTPVRGSLSLSVPPSQVLLGALDPVIDAGGTVITVEPSVVHLLGLDPSVSRGALIIAPDPAVLRLSALGAVPLAGDLVVSVQPSAVALSALDPTVLQGLATPPVYFVLETTLAHRLALDTRLAHTTGLH